MGHYILGSEGTRLVMGKELEEDAHPVQGIRRISRNSMSFGEMRRKFCFVCVPLTVISMGHGKLQILSHNIWDVN